MAVEAAIGQELIDEIVRRVLTVARPERIVLLEFPVAERQGRELDVDLLVVEKDPGDPRARSVRVGDALRGLGLPISAVVITPEKFRATRDAGGSIASYVKTSGRTLLRPDEETRELVGKWCAKAEEDFHAAREGLSRDGPPLRSVTFHAQQCAEKYLKALILRHGIEPPQTMNIGYLLDILEGVGESLASLLSDATQLDTYGLEFDYPLDFPDVSSERTKEAFELASKVRDAVREALGEFVGGGERGPT